MILEIIYNQIFQATLISVVLAQILKIMFENKTLDLSALFSGAGMPSSHTATVVALSLSIYFTEGISTLFVITLVFSGIVIRDVLGDKIFARQQEEKINAFIQEFVKGEKVHFKHLVGHNISEVLAGVVIGTIVTFGVFFLDLDLVSTTVYQHINVLLL